ncbi:MAG: hypothetical protein DWQ02_16890 [Bacteroidetes bacterium]|nr:MAG: hypothetical protein DWQ02_16890 [Bacteroidota bacterium]
MKYFWKFLLVLMILFSGCVKDDDGNYTIYGPEDLDGPQLVHPYTTDQNEMAVYEFMDNELLDNLLYVYPESLIGELMEAKAEMESLEQPIEIVFIMTPGFGTDENFFQFGEQLADRLTRPYASYPPDGVYSLKALQLVTSDTENSFVNVEKSTYAKAAKLAKRGGICATLAIAHSLVRRLNGLVPREATGNWESVTETNDEGNEVWDPDFLRTIYRASGDTDGSRGLTNEQIERAHTADYSSSWRIRISRALTAIKREGTDMTNAQLAVKCEDLKNMIEENRDDCLLRLLGKKTVDGREVTVGHRMTITGVDCSNGSMKITTINTGRQDRNNDWENVPYNPGEEEWEITPDGINPPAHWEHIDWEESFFSCFDEEPKDPQNVDPTRGEPGTIYN